MRLIDPKDLLDYINEQKICGECESCTDTDCMNCFTTDLEDIPTIEAEPVIRARWISRGDGYCHYCSSCSGIVLLGGKNKYCMYCGAKMDNAY